jgi:ABC-type nitrate/sulfonate/bicarbonate transport system ATPase subunit
MRIAETGAQESLEVKNAHADVALKVENLGRTFQSGESGSVIAFENVNFEVRGGEFVTIIGPSGCGKTTLLNVIAGLLQASEGVVLVDGEVRAKRESSFGYMFQKDLLLPWRNVRDNIALGLEIQGVGRSEARKRASGLAGRFGLGPFLKKYPVQLSGGMRQRAALMRTLACDRPILLLDEPFGALDALTRSIMQEWLLEIWSGSGRTVVFITHDIEEAIFLSDRVFVMTARPGRLKAEIPVHLPRPRTYDTSTMPEFVAIKHQLIGLIHAEGLKALGQDAGGEESAVSAVGTRDAQGESGWR